MSVSQAKRVSKEPLELKDAKWITLQKITYKDPTGQERTWESAERQTRPANSDIDAVGILAILYNDPKDSENNSSDPSNNQNNGRGPLILLQKQYRPAIDRVVIETPAGLCDPGESPIECALRELLEETGYTGHIITSSFLSTALAGGNLNTAKCQYVMEPDDITSTPVMFDEPGFSNTALQMIHVAIDLSLPANQEPKPRLEESEFIECFTVRLGDLWGECWRLEREGYAIDAKVGGLAEGIEMAKRFGLFAKR